MKMATPIPKSALRVTQSEWDENILKISALGELTREESRQLRNEGVLSSMKMHLENIWKERKSNFYLSTRLEHLWQWKCKLERTLDDVYREMDAVKKVKEQVEKVIDEQLIPEEVNRFCLVRRDNRLNLELVTDEVHRVLINENRVISESGKLLTSKSQRLFDEICTLQQIRDNLESAIENHRNRLDLEKEQIELEMKVDKTSLKPYSNQQVIIEEEEEEKRTRESDNLIKEASDEMEISQKLRQNSLQLINEREEERHKLREQVDYTLRKRIHEIKQAIAQLTWIKQQLEDETNAMQMSIETMEQIERNIKRPTKLLETRLEKRREREDTNEVFFEERQGLRCTREKLNEILTKYKEKSNDGRSVIQILEDDIADKSRAIQVEKECEQERQRMKSEINQRNVYTLPPVRMPYFITQKEVNPVIDDGRWQIARANYFN